MRIFLRKKNLGTREPVTFDEVNALAVQFKSLQVQISQLGGEYHAVALVIGNYYDDPCRSIARMKTENYQGNRRLPIKHQSQHLSIIKWKFHTHFMLLLPYCFTCVTACANTLHLDHQDMFTIGCKACKNGYMCTTAICASKS